MESVNPALERLLIEGSFRRAIEVFGAEWTADARNSGPDRPETVRSQVRYADVLRMAGDYDEAVKMYNEVLSKMEVLQFAPDEVYDVKLSLANIYKSDFEETAVLIEDLESFIARTPMDDAKMTFKGKVAATLRDLGRYESALQHFEEIYQFKCNNDPRSLDALSSQVDIATVYLEQGRYNKAMDILKSVHKEAKGINPVHPCALKAERYIADVCVHRGLTLTACSMYKSIAQIQSNEAERNLDTLTTLHKQSLAYFKDGRPKEALEMIEDLLNKRIAETPCHPDTMRVEIDLMMMHLQMGDYSKATELFITTLERMSDCSEFEYCLIVDVPRNIAAFLRKQEQFDKAIEIYEFLHKKQCRMVRLGPHHPETLLTRTSIAEIFLDQKKLDDALGIFEEVLNTKLEVLKNDSMDCLDVRKHIAAIYFSQEKYEESFKHYCEVYRNERMYLGAYHDVTIDTENIVDDFSLKGPKNNLLKAVIENDLERVENFCKTLSNTDLDVQDCYGSTPLHVAVRAGHPKIVRFLLSRGASLYVKNKSGKIPRELAHTNEVRSIFNIIIQLFMDVKLGNLRDISEVLSFYDGSIINVLDEEGKTMLHWACQKGNIETVNLLLNKGADPRVKDKSGESSLDVAKTLNHVDIVQTMQRYLEQLRLRDLSLGSPDRITGYE